MRIGYDGVTSIALRAVKIQFVRNNNKAYSTGTALSGCK